MRNENQFQTIADGDETALVALVEQYYPDILRYCRWHAPDIASAEDAAQESFLKAIRYIRRSRFRGNFRPFLYQIARNTCIDMKKAARNSVVPLEDMNTEPSKADDAMEQIDRRVDVLAAVSTLPEEEQELIRLRFGQDLKLREIAEILNLPARTVQSRLRAAMKKLESRLKEV